MSDIEKPDVEPNFAALITDMFFAPVECRLEAVDGSIRIKGWRSEADLRRQLAKLAYAYGWNVEQEVVVPGWGRIDIVLHDPDAPNFPILIELKVELRQPAAVRKAFQQADGYGRWWKTTKNQPSEVVLCAATIDEATTRPVADAYPEVSLYGVGAVMGFLPQWRAKSTKRWMQARVRLEDARRVLAVHTQAVEDIERIEKAA